MGTFNVQVQVGDPLGERYSPVDALVDTGSTYSTFPSTLLTGLGVTPRRARQLELADNRIVEYPIGTASLLLEGDEDVAPVIFAPDDSYPIIGATTLEIFGLAVDPTAQKLIPVVGLWK